jgi:hypothetical protein
MLTDAHIALIVLFVMNTIVSDPVVKSPGGDAGCLGRDRETEHIHFAPTLGTEVSKARFGHGKRSYVPPVDRNLNPTPVLHRRFRLPCPSSGPLVQ